VTEKCRCPCRCSVATHARCRGRDVLHRLERTGEHAACGMAGHALPGRTVEKAVHMAALATCETVRAGELKSRHRVIKVEPTRLIRGSANCRHSGERGKCERNYDRLAACDLERSIPDSCAQPQSCCIINAILLQQFPAPVRLLSNNYGNGRATVSEVTTKAH